MLYQILQSDRYMETSSECISGPFLHLAEQVPGAVGMVEGSLGMNRATVHTKVVIGVNELSFFLMSPTQTRTKEGPMKGSERGK